MSEGESCEGGHWEGMPRDVLELIIDAAKIQGPINFRKFVSHASLACKHWLNVTNEHITELRAKAIWGKPLEHLLHRMKLVNSIKLSAARYEALEILVNYPRITALDLSEGCKLNYSGMTAISRCTHLCELNLQGCYGITDAGLELLEANCNLQSLDLGDCEDLTGTSFFIFQKMQNLSRLNLADCIRVDKRNFKILSEVGSLTTLNMAGTQVNDQILHSLCALENLRSLNLRACSSVSDAGVRSLISLPGLQTLDLSCCMHVTDLSMDYLPHLTSLTELHLNSCDGMTQASTKNLSRLTNLRTLNIQRLPLTPDGLAGFSGLESLKHLDIRGIYVLRRNVTLLRRELGGSRVNILYS